MTSEWRYETSTANREADVANVRSCNWLKAGVVDVVPGKVVNSYISRRTVQRVTGKDVRAYSQYLANKLSGEKCFSPRPPDDSVLGLLSSDDCEDLVAIYLQSELGYLLVPSSCKSSTAVYEYVLRHSRDGHKAVAQVKQGANSLHRGKYSDIGAKVYLLTTRGQYLGPDFDNVICLTPTAMEQFAVENYRLMPDRIKYWIDFYREVRT